MIDFEKEEEIGGIGMKKFVGLLCVLAVCLSLTACSAEEALVDILSKAIAQALEENNMSLPDESSEETAEGTEEQNAGENGTGIGETTDGTAGETADGTSGGAENETSEAAGSQPGESADETESAAESTVDMAQLYESWSLVVGYWNAAEGHFAIPDMMDSHTAVFSYGIWDTEAYSGEGMVTELSASDEMELTATVHYAAQEANELRDAVEERTITVVIDYSGLDQDGKIRIKIGEDDWKHYMFAGNTSEEAYQTYFDNTFGGN